MAFPVQRFSLLLPALLAVIGVVSLATAVALVPMVIHQPSAEVSNKTPEQSPRTDPNCGARRPDGTDTDSVRPVDEPAQDPDETQGIDASAADDDDLITPEPSAGSPTVEETRRLWQLAVDPGSKEIQKNEQTTLDEITAHMKSHLQAQLVLTGINNPAKSRRRAKNAAQRIKEVLVKAGIARSRLRVEGAQEPDVADFMVRAEITGDER